MSVVAVPASATGSKRVEAAVERCKKATAPDYTSSPPPLFSLAFGNSGDMVKAEHLESPPSKIGAPIKHRNH